MSFYVVLLGVCIFFFFKQKTAYEMRISDWSSDVCSSDLKVTSKVKREMPVPVSGSEGARGAVKPISSRPPISSRRYEDGIVAPWGQLIRAIRVCRRRVVTTSGRPIVRIAGRSLDRVKIASGTQSSPGQAGPKK